MPSDETNKDINAVQGNGQQLSTTPADGEVEAESAAKGGWRDAFRIAFDRARRQQKPVDARRELGRDKSKALLVLVGVTVALLLVFFGLFSSPKKRAPLRDGQPNLGRRVTPGQENSDPGKTVTPILSADVRSSDPAQAGRVTAEDVGRTSRTGYAAPRSVTNSPEPKSSDQQDYALGRVDFSDPLVGQGNTLPSPPPEPASGTQSATSQNSDLKKPSLIFVLSTNTTPATKPRLSEDEEATLALPAGTRLVARLQAPVSSAVAAPVVAVVEYNYERNGQIVLPAGAKVFGRLAQVNPSGHVGIQFHQVELPDGTTEKIEASAMDLNFGPLKGNVSGKKTGTKFLVRSLTGLGTVASYLVGAKGTSSDGLISTNALMRERLASNVATAGQEQLNSLAFNQNIVVTVPGNTRFYIVLQKPTSATAGSTSGTRNTSLNAAGLTSVPTLEELRQLIQLRREINELYTQSSGQPSSQTQQQQ